MNTKIKARFIGELALDLQEAEEMARLAKGARIRNFDNGNSALKPHRKNRMDSKTNCSKTRYRDHREAEKALHRIQVKKQWFELDGIACRRMESRIYFHGECQGFHLTSQTHDNGGVSKLDMKAA